MKRILLLLLVFIQTVSAQNFPVRVTSQVLPPYPTSISGYANTSVINSPLRVQLVLSDITTSSREVRLRVAVEGNGISATSAPVVVGAPTLILDGGVPLNLTLAELAPYYELQNLQGISPVQYNSSLPDGAYRFCFEVFDAFNGNRLSAPQCSTIFLVNNQPPFLNKPDDRSSITEQNPTNIIFQWTPRHVNVPNVNYEFSLVEVWDKYIDPQAIFLASPPLYQEITINTSLVYGPLQPLLIPGKRYAWRVRAFANNNGEEVSVFNNNGNSEIFWFDYLGDCNQPTGVSVKDVTRTNATISWTGHPDHLDYTVYYREQGSDRWYQKTTPRDYITIDEFKENTVYEYKVKGHCTEGSYGESVVDSFRTLTEELEEYTACGIQPDPVDLSNQELLAEVYANDVFTAGDFPVYIKELSSPLGGGAVGGGGITGEGYISTPWLATVRIPVKFENIKINTDMKLVDGFVVTTYDPNWGSIVDADDIIEVVTGDDGDIDVINVDNDIVDIEVNDDGTITIITADGQEIIQPGGEDVIYVDNTGETWQVGEDGTVTQGEQAEGGPANSGNTNGVGSGGVDEITATGVRVDFIKSGYYAVDTYPQNAGGSIANKYESIPVAGGGTYYPMYKAVSNLPDHTSDILTAQATFNDNDITKEDIIFKTKEGVKVQANWNGNTATLSIRKAFEFGKEEIIAAVKPKDSTAKFDVAGNAYLWHLASQEVTDINVTLIPVNGASISNSVANRINEIYNPAGINFNVSIGSRINIPQQTWDLNGNGQLDIGDSKTLAQYTEEEKAINAYFKANATVNSQMYYLFVTDMSVTKDGVSGFMPLKRQYGFVFDQSDIGRTAAHELGHGVFGLEHPFTQYNTTSGATDLLMDYGNGITFNHMEWEKMHAPGIQIYWFQGDEDGEFSSYQYLVGYNVVPDLFITHLDNYTANSISFISAAGKIISLPNTAKDVTFGNGGTLLAFTIPENGKEERYIGGNIIREGEPIFKGYLKEFGTKEDWNQRVYKDNFSKNLSAQTNVHLGKLKKTNEDCGIELFSKSFSNTASKNEWNSGGNNEPIVSTDFTSGLNTFKQVNSPEACDLCKKGEEFYKLHANIEDEKVRAIVLQISKLICLPDIDTSFYDEFTENGYKSLLEWQKNFYNDGFWPNDYEAYKAFYDAFNNYIEYYLVAKTIIQTSEDKKSLLRIAYNLSVNQLEQLTAEEKLKMLKVMTKGYVGGYWFGGNFNIEALALKIVKSINNDRGEEDQIKKFLDGLVSETYKVDDKLLYENLFNKIDDYFGKDNFTELILRFTQLSLTTYAENDSKITLEWGARNESFVLNFIVSGNDYIFDFNEDKVYVTGKCIEKNYTYNQHGQQVETGCKKYYHDNVPLNPFSDLVTLTILKDTNILPSFMCGNPDVQWCGTAIKVPAVFLPYLQEK